MPQDPAAAADPADGTGAARPAPRREETAPAGPAGEAFALLGDEPVAYGEQDALGAATTAERLAALLLASRPSTPLILAVDGRWGMGKSSLMHLTDRRLRAEAEVRTVWYNAWTASGGDVLEGLIKSVLTGLDPNVLRRGLRRLRDSGPLGGALRALLTVAAGLLNAAGPVNELWDRMSADARARNEMRDVLRDLVTDWSERLPDGTGGRLLVVFVDDLDRCSEQTVLGVCEALKLYLDVPGLAFVIGCDRSALGPGRLLGEMSPAASVFLEKIFQTSYPLPPPADQDVTAYVTACARAAGIDALLDDDLTRLLVERSGRNPRRIKRLVNGLVLEVTLNTAWRGLTARAVLRLLLLQYFYADFYRMMSTPRAAGERDTLTDFRDYRLLRGTVRHPPGEQQLTEAERTRVADQLHYYDVPFAAQTFLDPPLLQALERQLPDTFRVLASDHGFLSLLDELLELEESEEVLARLRYARPLRQPGDDPADDPGDDPAARGLLERDYLARHAPGRRPGAWPGGYRGLRVLWVDDNPEGVEADGARTLRGEGAEVRVAGDERAADLALADGPPDVLVSDIKRGENREAGFDYVRRLRDAGTYTGPVVYFTSETSQARRDLAREVGALGVAVAWHELFEHLDQAMAVKLVDEGRAPNDPRARPSGDPPT